MLWVKLYRSPAVKNAVYVTSRCSTQGWLTQKNRATGPNINYKCLFYPPEDAIAARLVVKHCQIETATTSCPQECFETLFFGFVV